MTPLVVSNVLLWILVVALSLVVVALARQLGVLHERITPVGALMLAKGLKVGELAPAVPVVDLDGRTLTIGGARGDGRSLLLMFVSPTCPVCKALLPVLKSSRRSEESWAEIVLASDGDLAEQRAFVREQGLDTFRYVVSAPLGISYQVGRLPYAVLIDPDGVLRARGIINSREHLESLFEAKRLGVASLQEFLEERARHEHA
ncbi:MAG: methylamine dehydrogenase accessory protein MauD [Proteobacteria bacterium]|nr:methylamine dehydrogenase accessory protein MauD [Pseudomonadota bacterium]